MRRAISIALVLELGYDLAGLAGSYRSLHRYDDARRTYERALAIQEKHYGPDHTYVAETLMGLGLLEQDGGHPERSVAPMTRSIAILEKSVGRDNPYTARSLKNLALVYSEVGRHDDAVGLAREAVVTFESAESPEYSQILMSRVCLGRVLTAAGRPDDAITELQPAMSIAEDHFEGEAPYVSEVAQWLAMALEATGRLEAAERMRARVTTSGS